MTTQKDRVPHILKFMEYDQLSDNEHEWVCKFEKTFDRQGYLSDRAMEILEDIFKRAAEKA